MVTGRQREMRGAGVAAGEYILMRSGVGCADSGRMGHSYEKEMENMVAETGYRKHGKGQHQWKKVPAGRRKCLLCGEIQRRNNTTEDRIRRRRKAAKKSRRPITKLAALR